MRSLKITPKNVVVLTLFFVNIIAGKNENHISIQSYYTVILIPIFDKLSFVHILYFTVDEDWRVVGEGENCGGIAGIQCKNELECKYDEVFLDAMGKCVQKGKVNVANKTQILMVLLGGIMSSF